MRYFTLIALLFIASPSFALKGFDTTSKYSGNTNTTQEIEIRNDRSRTSESRIRGEVDSSGDFRGRDVNGNRFKGSIDEDGYGKIRDSEGNTYKVKPR